MNVDPETRRKAEDLRSPKNRNPNERDANDERRHLDQKAEEIISEAARRHPGERGGTHDEAPDRGNSASAADNTA